MTFMRLARARRVRLRCWRAAGMLSLYFFIVDVFFCRGV